MESRLFDKVFCRFSDENELHAAEAMQAWCRCIEVWPSRTEATCFAMGFAAAKCDEDLRDIMMDVWTRGRK